MSIFRKSFKKFQLSLKSDKNNEYFTRRQIDLYDNKRSKQSHYRPGQALKVPGGWGPQISTQSAHESDKVVSSTHGPPLPTGIFLVLIYVRGWVNPRAIRRPEGFVSMKNSIDTIGNRTRGLRACSAVPQPTVSPAACPFYDNIWLNYS
jgi:hypothetical protein